MDDDPPASVRRAAPNLRTAMRNARIEEAERSQVRAELRGAEIARLEMLRDAIGPVLAQIPADVDTFDVGLMPGLHPRLFIDMIAFVEMGHDKRLYRFVQDTRHARVTLAESESLDVLVDAVAAYLARRLIDRDKALASDGPAGASNPSLRAAGRPRDWPARIFDVLLEYIGIFALSILAIVLLRIGYAIWRHPLG